MALVAELLKGRLHVNRVPKHFDVHNKTKASQLVFLPFAVTLANLAASTMKCCSGQPVPTLTSVQLCENPAAIGFVVDVFELVERLGYATNFRDSTSQR
jgi:hypothetical protein